MRRTLVLLLFAITTSWSSAANPEPLVRLGSDRFRQAERVTALAYSPDGKQLASADEHTVYLWDAADGRPRRTIVGSEDRRFVAVHFNADATALFAVALNEKSETTLYQFNPADGKTVATTNLMRADMPPFDDPSVVQFSPDGAWLAIRRGNGQEIAVMNTATRKMAWSDSQAKGKFRCFAFQANSAVLAVGGWDGVIRLVDVKAGGVTHNYKVAESAIGHLAFGPDGTDLVASVHVGDEADVMRFEATTGKERWRHRTGSAHDLFFSVDGKAVVYFGPARKTPDPYLWHWLDAETGKLLRPTLNTGWHLMVLRPDRKVMAIGNWRGHITQWDVTTRKRLDGSLVDPPEPVTGLRFGADGRTIRGWCQGWYEWDVATGKQARLTPVVDIPMGAQIIGSPDLKWVAESGLTVSLTDVASGRRKFLGFAGQTILFFPDNRLAVVGIQGLRVYDPTSDKWVVHIDREGFKVVSADGSTAVVVTPDDGRLRGTRYDLTTGKPAGAWEGRLADPSKLQKSHGWWAELSPDGRVLAVFFSHLAFSGMGFNEIHELHTALFDARTGRYLSGWWDLHSQASLAFSPDGRTVACYYPSGLGVDIREVATGERRTRRSNPPISSAAFSPDGRKLAMATSPSPVALWDVIGKPTWKWADEKPPSLWDGLASTDAEVAFDVIRVLRQHPNEAIAFLKERMKLPTVPTADWLAARIKDLDAANFKQREQASKDLDAAGEIVVPALRDALKGSSPEMRQRLEGLLAKAETPGREHWRATRACEVLEGIATPEAREILVLWATGAPRATLTREAMESVERLNGRK